MGGNALRTRESAAAQVGAAVEEIDALVAAGRLRVLPVADGGWITTARAVSYAVRGRTARPRARKRRAAPPPRRAHAARAALERQRTTPARVAAPAPPVHAAPEPQHPAPAPVAAPAPPAPTRAVEPDRRPDIAVSQRLDLAAAAAHLGVTPQAALRLMQRGVVRATRLGREWITTTRALAEHRRSGAPG